MDARGVFSLEVGSGVPLVLLHGFGLDHRSLLSLDPGLESAGEWQRLYLDLQGAPGARDSQVRSAQEVADRVVQQVVDRLGDRPFAVLGASFGGMIARHVAHALRPQVLGLATLAGVFVAAHDGRRVPPRRVLRQDPEVDRILGAQVDRYREDAVVESAEDARAFLRHVLPGLLDSDQATLERISSHYALDREPEEAWPAPFDQPTLHITGRQDDVVGYRDGWDRIEHYPRGTFVVLDAAGHNLLFEQAELCSALVVEWLARIRR